MIKTQNAGILQAIEVVREMSLSRRLRLTYEAHLKAIRDRKAQDEYLMRVSEERGEAKTLLMILESKGEVPEKLRHRILTENYPEKLDDWVKLALSVPDVQEFIKWMDADTDRIRN